MHALARLLRQAGLIALISLVLLLLVDQALRRLLPPPAAWAPRDPAATAPDREQADAVRDQPWIAEYWREHAASKDTAWQSYVYWRRTPYAGHLIHIDAHGFRVTPPPAQPAQRTLWMFGGSVVWGTGNRDQGTLAAALQQLYAERAPDLGVRVLNFGESGYVSRQSLTAFQLALACPEPPADLAVFLDGANDVYAALQSGVAGLPQNEANRVLEFNSARQFRQQAKAWALRLEGIARLVAAPAPALDASAVTALAEATIDAYRGVVLQARALGQAYDVPVLHLWQPTVFDRPQAIGDEARIIAAAPALHGELQRAARRALHIDGVFDPIDALAVDEALYFDFVHLSERGQRLLAERLYALSLPLLQARAPRTLGVERCRDRPLG